MNLVSILCSTLLFLTGCNNDDNRNQAESQVENNIAVTAQIISVTPSGTSGNFTFSVGISSPDTGCDQYANWWEVISEDGSTLIYRRILAHSHVDEQPFIRSGGSVAITTDQIVIVRAHMNTSGYGTTVFKGSVDNGFVEETLDQDFAENLASQQPLPSGCAF